MACMRLHHIALRTRDPARLERFYADVLGLAVTRRDGDRSAWMDLGEGAVLMIERAGKDEPPPQPGSMEMFALAIPEGAHASFRERLARAGVAIEHATAHTLYLRDPDGRRVGLSDYRF